MRGFQGEGGGGESSKQKGKPVYLVLTRFKEDAVVTVSRLAKLIDEREIVFLNDGCQRKKSWHKITAHHLVKLAFLDRVRQQR